MPSFAGSPRMIALDSSYSPIPTRRAISDISEIYFAADSVFDNFRLSKRVVFKDWLVCM